MELTNALRRLIKSLDEAKHRRENGLFCAEGTKCIADTAGAFHCRYLFGRRDWLESHDDIVTRIDAENVFAVNGADMQRMTHLSTPPSVIAVYDIPDDRDRDLTEAKQQLTVALDRIQDPGNLGTIIRLCDWMGVTDILASHDTADVWSPKVVQATMGAIARIHVCYCNLTEILSSWPSPVYGTYLDAPDIYTAELSASGVIVFGNEGQGISPEVSLCVNRRLYIPSFPTGRATSESLNVATAAAITLSQFRSRQLHSRN